MQKYFLLLVSFIVLSCSPLKKYQSLPEVKSWETSIQKFEQLDKSESYSEEAILFGGSSSILLWSTLERDMAPYPVIQRGYGGAKLSDFAVYAGRIINPHPCRAIVLFVANDITGSDKDKSPKEVVALLRNIIKTIRKTHPETPVFWIAVTPSELRWKAWPVINKTNNMIKSMCDKHKNLYFIRTDFAFIDENGKPRKELFRPDMLHLNDKGYEVWSKIIKSELIKVIPPPKVEIIGHRGSSYIAPENTVSSAKLAWQEGADAVETDIYLSKDNKIMVSHDANTKRTSGKNYLIAETQSDTLRKLDIGSFQNEKYKGEKIPFLEELIQTIPSGKELVIEIKCGSEVLPYLKETIKNSGINKRFVFISFDLKTISDTKKVFPENSCYWLCSDSDLVKKNIHLVSDAGLEGISLSYNIINKEIVKIAKQYHLDLFTWTVDNPEEAKKLISFGVKGITTNRPGWLRDQISPNQ